MLRGRGPRIVRRFEAFWPNVYRPRNRCTNSGKIELNTLIKCARPPPEQPALFLMAPLRSFAGLFRQREKPFDLGAILLVSMKSSRAFFQPLSVGFARSTSMFSRGCRRHRCDLDLVQQDIAGRIVRR